MLTSGIGNVTSAQRRRQMGHKDDNTLLAYISRTSGVDVQAIISGTPADQDFIDFVASMQTSVDRSAPGAAEISAGACAEA